MDEAVKQPRYNSSSTRILSKIKEDIKFLEKIGSGCFGSVYKARSKTLGRVCAVKVIQKVDLSVEDQTEAIKNEHSILYELDHPYIIKALGDWEDHQTVNIIFDFKSRGDLCTLFNRTVITNDQIKRIILDLGSALNIVKTPQDFSKLVRVTPAVTRLQKLSSYPSMALSQSKAFGNLLNPQTKSQSTHHNVAGGNQNSVVVASLHGLNNHAELRTSSRSHQDGSHTSSQSSDRGIARGQSRVAVPAPVARQRPKVRATMTASVHSQFNSNQPQSLNAYVGKGLPLEHQPNSCDLKENYCVELTKVQCKAIDDITASSGLDEKHRQFARDLAEVSGETYRHLSICANIARLSYMLTSIETKVDNFAEQIPDQVEDITMRVSNKITNLAENIHDIRNLIQSNMSAKPSTHSGSAEITPLPKKTRKPWIASTELKTLISSLSVELLPLPDIQAYTATEDRAKRYLQKSLFNLVKVRVAEKDNEWTERHLPGKILGVHDAKAIKDYESAIRSASKHAREKLHLLTIQLLTNINHQKNGQVVDVAVPTLMALWHRIALKCGIIDGSVDPGTAWAAADGPLRTRIAYLRREAARLHFQPSTTNIWCEVDHQLDKLREKDRGNPDYSTSGWGVISQNYILTLPSEETILAGTPGGEVVEELAAGSNNEEMEQPDENEGEM
ncbi:hypothetical protein DFH28DRAFT_1127509 [Melampsora americana]|nr:hypothetical protein DFH28DRAFT_1127509 [Melampsora americana]